MSYSPAHASFLEGAKRRTQGDNRDDGDECAHYPNHHDIQMAFAMRRAADGEQRHARTIWAASGQGCQSRLRRPYALKQGRYVAQQRYDAAPAESRRRQAPRHAPMEVRSGRNKPAEKVGPTETGCLAGPWHQTSSRRTSRFSVDLLPIPVPWVARKDSAQRRPSSRSMLRNSHSALNLEEAPSLSTTVLARR